MSNLIITIMSIALVAVAALVGVWYGGSVFEDAQNKSEANAAASQAQQIASAALLYGVQQGGYSFDSATVTSLASNGVYLDSTPIPPSQATQSNKWTLMNLTNGSTTTGLSGVELDLDTTSSAIELCNTFVQLGGGTSPKKLQSSGDTDRTPTPGRAFDCLFWGSGTTPATGDQTYLVYPVSSSGGE